MRIAICDDDEMQVEILKEYLCDFFRQYHMELPSIAVFFNGEALLDDSEEKELVFLDIEMSGLDGIYVGTELTRRNNHLLIFIVTSYMEYLDAAMRFNVFRYLSKPIDKQRLFLNLKDALRISRANASLTMIETKTGCVTIPTHNIIMVEAVKNKISIYTTKGIFESVKSMNYWCEQLTEQCFYRSHRSFIINFDHVCSFDHFTICLYQNTYSAYLTRRKYTHFKNTYHFYLECKR